MKVVHFANAFQDLLALPAKLTSMNVLVHHVVHMGIVLTMLMGTPCQCSVDWYGAHLQHFKIRFLSKTATVFRVTALSFLQMAILNAFVRQTIPEDVVRRP